jgi:hypothetical protein
MSYVNLYNDMECVDKSMEAALSLWKRRVCF